MLNKDGISGDKPMSNSDVLAVQIPEHLTFNNTS